MELSGFDAWGIVSIVAVLLLSLLAANMLKRRVPLLKKSLIPTSVLAGLIILTISCIYTGVYYLVTGESGYLFNLEFFGSPSKEILDDIENGGFLAQYKQYFSLTGLELLEIITYHSLALGFIATAFKPVQEKLSKKRGTEVFNAGVTTVSTYLLQAILGMAITMIAALFVGGLTNYSGVILCFGYGQGTGQAFNFGQQYQNINNGDPKNAIEGAVHLADGTDFGLSIASLGFISAAIGGVIFLNILRRRAQKKLKDVDLGETVTIEKIQTSEELPMESSGVDKITLQLAFILGSYFAAYGILFVLAKLIPSMSSTIYGFNFLIGVLVATAVCFALRFMKKKKIIKHEYINHFLMKRIAGFFFDIMIISGMAAIKPDTLGRYWHVLLILGVVGAVSTFFYLRFISKKLFPEYKDEQFLATYGMLTGTASTGIILLREWDPHFKTPAADNLVYQNFPAIVFGLPIMLLAAPRVIAAHPYIVWGVLIALFIVMNVILFRSFIFKRRKKRVNSTSTE